ncbi:MAG: DedA family protein [Rhodospirillaceae bacterium]|nr:DedA family protein [Rhodospirillaceae bacterium]
MDVAELIREYENLFYAITFGWAFIEGESFLIFAGAAAFKGDLNIYILILAAWWGSFLGDQCWFALGRFFGAKLLVRLPKLKAGVSVAMDMVQKYDVLFILSFRFIYGVRNVASPALGMNGYPWGRFAVFNFIAAFIWANSFAWGGYILAKAFEEVLGDISENFGYVMLGVFAIVCCILFFVHRSGQKRYKKMLAQSEADPPGGGGAEPGSGASGASTAGGSDR